MSSMKLRSHVREYIGWETLIVHFNKSCKPLKMQSLTGGNGNGGKMTWRDICDLCIRILREYELQVLFQ